MKIIIYFQVKRQFDGKSRALVVGSAGNSGSSGISGRSWASGVGVEQDFSMYGRFFSDPFQTTVRKDFQETWLWSNDSVR